MSPTNLAVVGLRLLAVYCFVQSLPLFASFGLVHVLAGRLDPYGRSEAAALVGSLLPGGSLLLVAILLYAFAMPLARRILPDRTSEVSETACSFEQLQTLAFAVAGVLVLAFALPSVFRAGKGLIDVLQYKKENGTVDATQLHDTWLFCAGVVAQVVVGLVLALGRRGFRNAWHWLRTARP